MYRFMLSLILFVGLFPDQSSGEDVLLEQWQYSHSDPSVIIIETADGMKIAEGDVLEQPLTANPVLFRIPGSSLFDHSQCAVMPGDSFTVRLEQEFRERGFGWIGEGYYQNILVFRKVAGAGGTVNGEDVCAADAVFWRVNAECRTVVFVRSSRTFSKGFPRRTECYIDEDFFLLGSNR